MGFLSIEIPQWSTVNPLALVLALVALLAMLRWKVGMGWVLFGSGLVSALYAIL
jgi:chromate transporter